MCRSKIGANSHISQLALATRDEHIIEYGKLQFLRLRVGARGTYPPSEQNWQLGVRVEIGPSTYRPDLLPD